MRDRKCLFARYAELHRAKKEAYEAAAREYFSLTDADYENPGRCRALEKRYEEIKADYEFHAKLFSEFVLENMDHITIK